MGNSVSSRALGNAHLDQVPDHPGATNRSTVGVVELVHTGGDSERRAANRGRRVTDHGVADDGRRSSDRRAMAAPMMRATGSTVIWFGVFAVMTAINVAAVLSYTSILKL